MLSYEIWVNFERGFSGYFVSYNVVSAQIMTIVFYIRHHRKYSLEGVTQGKK